MKNILVALCLVLSTGIAAKSFASDFISVAQTDLSKYDYVDRNGIIPDKALRRALTYYDTYYNKIQNKNYLTVIDMTQHITKKRMYVVDMKTGKVATYLVAHGKGSDPGRTGYATKFSNTPDSNMTSLGMYMTGVQYSGQFGKSMRLHGLESTNSKAYSRAIVLHGAWYVDPKYIALGRTKGCPAVEESLVSGLVDKLKNGSVYYIYGG